MIKWSKKLQTQKIEYVVYSIKNLKSKKKYIGYTCNFARRMNEHRLMSKKKKLPKQNLLYRDLKRLGFDRFEFKKIQSFDTMFEAIEYEKTLMNSIHSKYLYNKQKYNKGTWKSGHKKPISEEELKTNTIKHIMAQIIDTQLKINLLLLARQ